MSEEKIRWQLEKVSNGRLKVSPVIVEFEDAYNRVHLKDYYLTKYNLPGSCLVNNFLNEGGVKDLENLFNEINLFKPREEVPTKRLDWSDDDSSSVLIRKGGRIEIARRTSSKLNSTINIIPIPDELKNGTGFFGQCARYLGEEGEVDIYGRHHYYLEEGQPEYYTWSEWMDQRYYDRVGKFPVKVEKPVKPRSSPELEKALLAFQYTKRNSDKKIITELLAEGLIKVNDKNTSLYNKYGYWMGRFEEGRDSSILIAEAVSWLSPEELNLCKKIFDKYLLDEVK